MLNVEAYYQHEAILHEQLSKNELDSLVTISIDREGNVTSSHSVDNSNIYTLIGALEQMKHKLIDSYTEQ